MEKNKMADIVRRLRRIRYIRNRLPFDNRVFRDRANPLESLSREEIRDRYRFYPESVIYLCQLVNLERDTKRSSPLPPLLTTLVALHFFATGTHHIVTATLHGISRSIVCRAVKQFTDALCEMINQFVNVPVGDALTTVQRAFYNIAGFPHVVGAVDGTQIRIQAPSHDEDDYVNRKGYHSINVQMICDASFKLLNVVAKWPGSVHDARIFRESEICGRFERGEIQGLLLGDSGYPCRRYLLTPYQTPQTPVQERYNRALCRTRVVIEQAFGVLKRRFPCLQYGLRVTPVRAAKITGCCVILHNIGMDRNDIFPRECDTAQEQPTVEYDGVGTGNHFRDHIANAFFG